MNFANVAQLTTPRGEVYQILRGGTVLWTKSGEPTPPPVPPGTLPPNTEIWYEATSKLSGNYNSTSHTWNSETGKGVLTYDSTVTSVGSGWFEYQDSLIRLWFPNSLSEVRNAIKANSNLEEIYFGSGFYSKHTDGIGGNSKLRVVKCYNNPYWENNETALVSTTQHPVGAFQTPTLVTGTNRTDLRNSACQIIGSRCICDMNLTGCTLYFGNSITRFEGDYNIGTTDSVYTMYWYSSTAPTSDAQSTIRCASGTVVYVPEGSVSSYQSAWGHFSSFSNIAFRTI